MTGLIKSILFFIALIIISLSSCKTKTNISDTETIVSYLPPIIIYKTKKDYSNNVPVLLSEDKSKIVSFPDVKDLRRNGEYCKPTLLEKGYFLDNRGINENVAFLSFTYEEYSSLTRTPLASDLFEKVIDNKPLKSMYICGKGSLTKEKADEINLRIKKCKLGIYQRVY